MRTSAAVGAMTCISHARARIGGSHETGCTEMSRNPRAERSRPAHDVENAEITPLAAHLWPSRTPADPRDERTIYTVRTHGREVTRWKKRAGTRRNAARFPSFRLRRARWHVRCSRHGVNDLAKETNA